MPTAGEGGEDEKDKEENIDEEDYNNKEEEQEENKDVWQVVNSDKTNHKLTAMKDPGFKQVDWKFVKCSFAPNRPRLISQDITGVNVKLKGDGWVGRMWIWHEELLFTCNVFRL